MLAKFNSKICSTLGSRSGAIYEWKDWLIGLSQGSILFLLAEVRANQSIEHHLRVERSGDCEFRLILRV